jgi:N-acetyl-gamma-glutamyl-phosphate reductase
MAAPIVFIDGDQGTTGLHIHEHLRGRSNLQLLTLPATERKDLRRRAEAINSCDIAILCLPDDAAREAVAAIDNPAVRVIDASSAHRTSAGWVYGFPEWQSTQPQIIANAQRVSNPGCYPTGAIALLHPLIEAGLLPRTYPLSIHAVSGYSGAGRPAVERYENASTTAAPAFLIYGTALAHKHPPEIERYSGLAQRPLFVPAYGAFRQGIVLTIPLELRLLAPSVTAQQIQDVLEQHYAATAHVSVIPTQQTMSITELDPQALNGSNDMQLGVFSNEEYGHVLLTAVFDNLGKGAAGAAVQNLDLMLATTDSRA